MYDESDYNVLDQENFVSFYWSSIDFWKLFFVVLEYDQILPTNNNNNNRVNSVQEQRPTNSYIGLALLAFLIFPPVGKLLLDLYLIVFGIICIKITGVTY
jgi:hypothetical protein